MFPNCCKTNVPAYTVRNLIPFFLNNDWSVVSLKCYCLFTTYIQSFFSSGKSFSMDTLKRQQNMKEIDQRVRQFAQDIWPWDNETIQPW
jgi:hypothetical protein